MRAEAAIQAKLRSEAFQKAAHAKRSREDALAGYYAQEVCEKYKCMQWACLHLWLCSVTDGICIKIPFVKSSPAQPRVLLPSHSQNLLNAY